MRRIVGQLHNELFLLGDDGQLVASAQVVLLYREQHYSVRREGGIAETPLNRDFAFCASAAELRRLSEGFAKLADCLDESQGRQHAMGAAA